MESKAPLIGASRESDEDAVVVDGVEVGYEFGVVGDDHLALVLDVDQALVGCLRDPFVCVH